MPKESAADAGDDAGQERPDASGNSCVLESSRVLEPFWLAAGAHAPPFAAVYGSSEERVRITVTIPEGTGTDGALVTVTADHLSLNGRMAGAFPLHLKHPVVLEAFVIPSSVKWRGIDASTNRVAVECPLIPSRFGGPRSVRGAVPCEALTLEACDIDNAARNAIVERAGVTARKPVEMALRRRTTPLNRSPGKDPIATIHSSGFAVVTVLARQREHALIELLDGTYRVFGWVNEEDLREYERGEKREEPESNKPVPRPEIRGALRSCDQVLTLHAKMSETVTEVGTLSEGTAFHVVENQGVYTTITVPETPWLHPMNDASLAVETSALESCSP